MRALLPVLCVLALAACSDGKQAGPTTPRNEEAPNALSRTGVCSTSDFQVTFAPQLAVRETAFGVSSLRFDVVGSARFPSLHAASARTQSTGRRTRTGG